MDAYSLGQYLREAREANEIEVADAVAKLRIRQPILEAFEAGAFEIRGLPEIQVRGLLRIYARFLELDEGQTLLLYDQMRIAVEKGRRSRRGRLRRQAEPTEADVLGKSQPLQEFQVAARRSAGCRGALRFLILLLLSAAAIGIIAFVTLELVDLPLGGEAAPAPAVAAVAATDTAGPLPTPSATFVPPTPSNRAQYSGSGILVSLLVSQRSWISFTVDGVEQYAGIAAPDTLLEYSAAGEITVAAGNAMALDVIWNGQQQGQFGGRGQRADIRFTADEAIVVLGPAGAPTLVSETVEAVEVAATAVPSNTAGPSPTATVTLVPSATFTPLPTNTPVPSDTPTATEEPPATAILPPRVTQPGQPATKEGG